MKVIALSSQKGGSGKTTLAGHIAVEAERTGWGPTALIDTDPQGSLADWWNERRAASPLFAHTDIARVRTDLDAMRNSGIKLVVFDTPPAITGTIETVVRMTDLVIIPARPSPHDLRAAGATVEIVERAGKSLVFVIKRCHAGCSDNSRGRHRAVATRHGRARHDPQPHRLRSQHDRRTHGHGTRPRLAVISGNPTVMAVSVEPPKQGRASDSPKHGPDRGTASQSIRPEGSGECEAGMSRRAAPLTASLMVRKGAAGPSHLEWPNAAGRGSRGATVPTLVTSAPRSGRAKARAEDNTKAVDKKRFTLRLSEDEHLRMRLASIQLHMSAQQMVMAALDEFLARMVPHIRDGRCGCVGEPEPVADGKSRRRKGSG